MAQTFLNQKLIDELASILEYDDRKWPDWRGHIGHFNVDGDSIVIYRSYADPREGCNAEKLSINPGKKGGISLRGYNERERSIKHDLIEIDMETAAQCILKKAKEGGRPVSDFASAILQLKTE